MMKRVFALLLCVATLLTTLVGCGSESSGATADEDKGQCITMYLTDNVYDFDPANAYNNEGLAGVVSLMFDTLFKLDDNGNVKKSLVKSYKTYEDDNTKEYIMELRLKDTCWSDGTAVSANDIVYAWKRLLEVDASYEAAALLFDIKNARAAKEGVASIDDVGIYPAEQTLLEIRFEEEIDYDQFLLNLTSVALAPLRDDIVSKSDDWAKKPGTMVCSGPFKLGRINFKKDAANPQYDPLGTTKDPDGTLKPGQNVASQAVTDFILERNAYYYRDAEEDSLFKSVTPYRICVDCSLTDEQLYNAYKAGMITYVGDIPVYLRSKGAIAANAVVADTSLSTASIYLNQNAIVDNGTEEGAKLFADAKVRKALSMAIDRKALVEAVVYAQEATGFIPTGVFEAGSKKTMFRDACTTSYEALKTDPTAAAALLTEAGVDPTQYSFTLTYPTYDEVQTVMAELVVKAWRELGFNVTLKARGTITNNDYYKYTESTPEDICDDLYAQDLRTGDFQAIILDVCAYSTDPFGMLAPFAKEFSGRALGLTEDKTYFFQPHITGFDNKDYNDDIENIFKEKDISKRAQLLRDAEAKLMDEMPVIPLVFNLEAHASSANLKNVSSTYYMPANFQKAKLNNYNDYLATGKVFINENYGELLFTDGDNHKDYKPAKRGFLEEPTFETEAGQELTSEQLSEIDKVKAENEKRAADIQAKLELFKTVNTIYSHFYADEKEVATEADTADTAAVEETDAAA